MELEFSKNSQRVNNRLIKAPHTFASCRKNCGAKNGRMAIFDALNILQFLEHVGVRKFSQRIQHKSRIQDANYWDK